jgi:hypothetical protein
VCSFSYYNRSASIVSAFFNFFLCVHSTTMAVRVVVNVETELVLPSRENASNYLIFCRCRLSDVIDMGQSAHQMVQSAGYC